MKRRPLELERFRAACRIHNHYWQCKSDYVDTNGADRMAVLTAEYAMKRHAANASDNWVFKHHILQHLGMQFQRDRVVVDCLVGERAHLLVKCTCENIKNTTTFEKTLLGRLLINHFVKVFDAETLSDHLKGSTCDLSDFFQSSAHVVGSKEGLLWGRHLRESDVVLFGRDPFLIQLCIENKSFGLGVVVSPLVLSRNVNRVADLFTVDKANSRIVSVSDYRTVNLCRAWCVEPDGSFLVLRV